MLTCLMHTVIPIIYPLYRFILKFYFILQIAYWVHCFPELYFLKAKKVRILFHKTLYIIDLNVLLKRII